jgi:predicted nucleotidyltransferase
MAMRLKATEVEVIKEAVAALDPEARVYLFGSRTDPTKKGGDIDLLVISSQLRKVDSLKILQRIFEEMEEQKIDVVIAANDDDPFVKIALAQGVEL